MLDQEAGNNFFNNIMDIWIKPEIERRQKDGKLSTPFLLNGAQIIYYSDGRPNFVRLNDEVKAMLIGVASRAIKVNEEFPLEDGLSEIREIKLSERDDPNAGHVTMILFKGAWQIFFDFRYNKHKALELVKTANEFLNSAKHNYNDGSWRPFVDNLFSATELLATAKLLLHADKEYGKRQWHDGTERRYVTFVNMGNYKIEYKDTFLELKKLRKSARYAAKEFRFAKEEAEKYLKVVEDMMEFTKKLLL